MRTEISWDKVTHVLKAPEGLTPLRRFPGVEFPGAQGPWTPALVGGPFGRFLMIFQIFEQIKIFEKCFSETCMDAYWGAAVHEV